MRPLAPLCASLAVGAALGLGVAPASADEKSPDETMRAVLDGASPRVKEAVKDAPRLRFQLLFSPVVVVNGKPTLERHGLRLDAEYFYPASSIKVAIALSAYEELARLAATVEAKGLARGTPLQLFPIGGASAPTRITLEHETRRALIASDNEGANRLLSFVGHKTLHERVWAHGARSVRVRARFLVGASVPPATVAPRIDAPLDGGRTFSIPERNSDLALPPTELPGLVVGEARMEDGKRVAGGLSFADKNAASLRDLQDLLVGIVRPDLSADPKPAIKAEDAEAVRTILRTLPSESGLPGFDRNPVADRRLRTYLKGLERVLPRAGFELYSKIGQAYGFTIDNAYVVEKATGKAFFLTACVYTNANEVLNDDAYGYDAVAMPLLADLAEAFARKAFGK